MKSFTGKERNKHKRGMALVTLQRSPSVAGSPPQCGSEGEADDDEGSKNEKSERFFAGKSTAVVLTPKDIQTQNAERRLSTDSTKSTNSTQSNNSDIQQHLQSMIDLLRPEETLKMAVKLESQRENRTRYLVITSVCCYRDPTTERKSKIIRHNSAKTQSSNAVGAAASVASTITGNAGVSRQLSMDGTSSTSGIGGSGNGNSNRTQQQQSQLIGVGNECVEMREKRLSSSSMPTSSNRQSGKCDADKNSASGDSKFAGEGVEESCLLGIDCNERTTIGLVVPILADTTIHLDGDGGFSVSVFGRTHIFKPVSVQAMWSALQTLHKVSQKARENNFYPGGPSHDWLSYYENRIESDQSCLNEWNAMDSLESRRPPSPDAIRNKPTAKEETESVIKMKLKEVMMSVDLDEVTSKVIRGRLEELLDMDLGEYKSFIDEEMLIILGQMDAPTEIFEHVYLGSEWNASNLEELQKNGVRHILNVTREIDNFFPGTFDYFNVRVYDDEKTNLLKHWDNTYRYISRAKSEGSKVLVHCKMGVSRSASVVIAYAMKAYNWEFKQALQHVKERRSCIKPNKNFLTQLETYRGMLDAMKNKEKLQRSKSETNLKSTKDARLLPGSEPTPLIQALNQSKSKSAGHGVSGDGVRGTVEVSGGMVSVSSINSASDQKQRRIMRRSSSTSPKSIQGHTAIVVKQQSHSLENLTPERSAADEPKNMRFPGSNGENYSVTQNQVRHIQKNTPPPPPPPPPPAAPVPAVATTAATASALIVPATVHSTMTAQQPPTCVRTIVHDLETYKDVRKTADDRKSLNLPFGRSVSHETSTRPSADITVGEDGPHSGNTTVAIRSSLGSPVWTSSAKLITQTSNLTLQRSSGEMVDAIIAGTAPMYSPRRLRCNTAGSSSSYDTADMFSSQVDSVFAMEEEEKRRNRKTRSNEVVGNESGGGIAMDTSNTKLGSNSSIDSASSSATSAVYEGCVRTRQRQRDIPSRHASWGSGDNRCALPMRNSSWGSYDTNRNTFQYSVGSVASAIFEGQIHELNKSNKTATELPPTHGQRAINTGGGNMPHHYHHVGTVKRTKLKLEECTSLAATQKKLCQENGEEATSDTNTGSASKTALPPTATSPQKSRSTNLLRSASAAGSIRSRYPLRCNSEEIVASGVSGIGIMPRIAPVMRRSDGSRPLQGELFSASAPESYTMSDIENKNTLPAQDVISSEDLAEEAVVLRNAPQTTGTSTGISTEEQRISGTVQILKKNFEAKASVSPSAGSNLPVSNALLLQTNTTKKGHQSLPSSPVAQHVDHSVNTETNAATATSPPSTNTSAPSSFDQTTAPTLTTTTCNSNVSSTATSNTSSSSSSSSSVFEPCDRNVKDLVHKYQATTTTPTTATTTVSAAVASSALATSVSNFKTRPRSYYDNAYTHRSVIGKMHEYSDGRPPPAPVKSTAPPMATAGAMASTTSTPMTESMLMHQQQQQLPPHAQPQRRLQQHGKTHPLSRLSLSKQSFNAAAYNTM